jgi:hypothetical protein
MAVNGHAVTAVPRSTMNCRRFISSPVEAEKTPEGTSCHCSSHGIAASQTLPRTEGRFGVLLPKLMA